MLKKNFKKLTIALLACLTCVGAFAWLSDSAISNHKSEMDAVTIGLSFVKEENTIALTSNEAIPMTLDYATENLTPFEFRLKNVGDIDLMASLYVVQDENETNFSDEDIMIVLEDSIGTIINIETLAEAKTSLFPTFRLNFGDYADFQLFAYIKEDVDLSTYTGNSIIFHLEVSGEQAPTLIPGIYDADNNLLKSLTVAECGEDASNVLSILEEYEDAYKLILPYGITSIGDSALYEIKLYELIIPNSVTKIGDEGINWAYNLRTLIVPNSVEEIGVFALENIRNVIYNGPITDDSMWLNRVRNGYYIPEEGFIYTDFTKRSIAWQYVNTWTNEVEVVIPDTVKRLEYQSFFGYHSENLIIPNSVEYIGKECFYNGSVDNITLSDNIKEIADSAFGEIELVDNVYYKGETYQHYNDLISALEANGVIVDEDAFSERLFWLDEE